ncbi:MAG: pyruvate dehydrogenase (acetyl-transferring) E1 component subunit alpha [Phycisphaerales bacterium]|nr:MAG: pyruvate dehydrogenase (acetyl-transferring) E1 component subunit alpha [Phycisphaerales bacterium]
MIVNTCEQHAAGGKPAYELDLRERTFKISHLQILDEKGNLDAEREPNLSAEDLIKLYRTMVLARAVDDRLLKLQRQGRIGTFPLCTGQEAASCGPALAMTPKDWFVGSFRELAGRLLRGEPIENGFLVFNGYEEGNTFPGGERTLPISIIIGAQALHAVGIAYAMKIRGETDSAVVCFVGDGATSQGDFHEAMNFASVWQVPVVFVCANNQWAISLPREKQTHSQTLAQKAIAYDMPGIQVDGNDALAMYQATKEALDRARAGEGPTFIEGVTYRLMMHTTSDDPSRYQPPEQLEAWQGRDPLVRFKSYLEAKGIWNDKQQAAMEVEIKQEIEDAVKAFEAKTDFKPDTPFDHVFGTEVPKIEEQRAEFLHHLREESTDA